MGNPYNHQFAAMLDALTHQRFSPTAAAAARFKSHRVRSALKALRCRNLFLAATGNYLAASSSNSFTVYTPPVGYDVIVMGCSLSADEKPDANNLSIIRGEVRIRPPVPLSDNYIQPQKIFAPATYSIYFPCPFLLRAGEQIAVDFGFNSPESQDAAVDTSEHQIVFFCIEVKDCLDRDDEILAKQMQAEIAGRDYQRKLLIPCANSDLGPAGQDVIILDANGFGEGITRPLGSTVLVTGYSLVNHGHVRVNLMDTAMQHNLTFNGPMKAPNLFWAFSPVEPGIVGPYYSYFRLPIPHVLRAGAQLACTALGNLSGAPAGPDTFALVWECLIL